MSMTMPRTAPPIGEFSVERSQEMLMAALGPGGRAEAMGFDGFEYKKVMDVGSGDGRYTLVPRELGATQVDAVELHQANIANGHEKGWYAGSVICANVIDLANVKAFKHKYDAVTVMNLTPNSDAPLVVKAAGVLLKNEGQMIVTLSELWRAPQVVDWMSRAVKDVKYERISRGPKPQPANNVLLVGTRHS